MRRVSLGSILWIAVAVLAFSGSTYFAILARRAPLPGVQASPQVLDFGSVRPHQLVKRTVQLENGGSENIVIQDIKTSCNYTAVTASREPLPSAHSRNIDVLWNSGARRGKLRDAIVVFFGESKTGRRGMMSVPIVAEVISEVLVSPESLVFSRSGQEPLFLEVKGRNGSRAVVIDSYSECLAFSPKVVSASQVEVKFEPSKCPDDLDESTITLTVESAEVSSIRVPVSIR